MNKVVYIIGVFDLFHRGHVEFLKKAKELGGRLIVAINGDDMVASYKRRPVYSEQDRLEIVRSCKYVDHCFIIDGYDNKPFLLEYGVTHIVHGDDWEHASYLSQIRVDGQFLKDHGIEMVFLPYWKGTSTSEILSIVRNRG